MREIQEHVKFDTDIGSDVDDALALAFLINSPDVELTEVTTVYGPTKTRLRAAKTLIQTMQTQPITLIAGEETPITPGVNIWTTGKEDYNLDENATEIDEIIQRATELPGSFSLVATGPLTNIAKLIQTGNFPKNCKQLVIMGGTLFPNVPSTEREHNFESDSEAAKIVFSQLDIPIVLIPLDLSLQYPMTHEQRRRFTLDSRKNIQLLSSWMDSWDETTSTFPVDSPFYKRIFFHDPLAAAYVARPQDFKTQKYKLSINTDGSVKVGEGKEITVCEEIDPKLIDHIVETILM